MDNDTLRLIDDKLNKIITQARIKLKISPKNKIEDKDKTIPKTKNKAEDKDKAKTNAKYIYEDIQENRYIRMFLYVKQQGNKKKVIG